MKPQTMRSFLMVSMERQRALRDASSVPQLRLGDVTLVPALISILCRCSDLRPLFKTQHRTLRSSYLHPVWAEVPGFILDIYTAASPGIFKCASSEPASLSCILSAAPESCHALPRLLGSVCSLPGYRATSEGGQGARGLHRLLLHPQI